MEEINDYKNYLVFYRYNSWDAFDGNYNWIKKNKRRIKKSILDLNKGEKNGNKKIKRKKINSN